MKLTTPLMATALNEKIADTQGVIAAHIASACSIRDWDNDTAVEVQVAVTMLEFAYNNLKTARDALAKIQT